MLMKIIKFKLNALNKMNFKFVYVKFSFRKISCRFVDRYGIRKQEKKFTQVF